MVAAGAMVSAAAWFEDVPWLLGLGARPLTWIAVATATASVVGIFRLLDRERTWTVRALASVTVVAILGGYFGAVYPVAIELRGRAPLTFHEAAAPPATLDAMALTLSLGSLFILPGLFWLYRIFKRPVV
jgi:cytochrome d ubiquinol oxidase subunit II